MHSSSTELAIDNVTAYAGHAVFAFIEADSLSLRRLDGSWWQGRGDLMISVFGSSLGLRVQGAWRAIVTLIPRAMMTTFVSTLSVDTQVFSDRRLLDRAMQNFVEGLLKVAHEQATAIERYAVERLIVEMGEAILLDRWGAMSGPRSPRAALRDQAIAVIAQQCADPNLTPTRVAREVHSSLRKLQIVFAEFGNSVAGEIRRQRTCIARSLLTDSRYDVLSIEQIAEQAGFRTTMSLRRNLEQAYKMTPRALRTGRSIELGPPG